MIQPIEFVEVFKDITDDVIPNIKPMYEISTFGRVRNKISGNFLSLTPQKTTGYVLLLFMLNDGTHVGRGIHRVEMMTFCPFPGMEQYQVDHINGIKTDNRISNLRWATGEQNVRYAIQNGQFKIGENSCHTTLSEETVRKACEIMQSGMVTSAKAIAEMVGGGMTVGIVNDIRNGKSWKSISKDYLIKPTSLRYAMSADDIEKICQWFVDHPKPEYQYPKDHARMALFELGMSLDNTTVVCARNIYQRKNYTDISSKYNFI